jgi:hypothetical protein
MRAQASGTWSPSAVLGCISSTSSICSFSDRKVL